MHLTFFRFVSNQRIGVLLDRVRDSQERELPELGRRVKVIESFQSLGDEVRKEGDDDQTYFELFSLYFKGLLFIFSSPFFFVARQNRLLACFHYFYIGSCFRSCDGCCCFYSCCCHPLVFVVVAMN